MTILGRPDGYLQLLQLGDPRKYLLPDGSIDVMRWEGKLGLVAIDFPAPLKLDWARDQIAQSIRVHPVSAEAWRRAFAMVYGAGLWEELNYYGGGFSVRVQRGANKKLSTHAWGLAGDFDVDRNQLGHAPGMNMAIVQIFKACGFVWGGEWMRPDGMHFQYCSGY